MRLVITHASDKEGQSRGQSSVNRKRSCEVYLEELQLAVIRSRLPCAASGRGCGGGGGVYSPLDVCSFSHCAVWVLTSASRFQLRHTVSASNNNKIIQHHGCFITQSAFRSFFDIQKCSRHHIKGCEGSTLICSPTDAQNLLFYQVSNTTRTSLLESAYT